LGGLVGCGLCWLLADGCNPAGLGWLLWLQSCLRWLALDAVAAILPAVVGSGSKFGLPTGPPAGQSCVKSVILSFFSAFPFHMNEI
jgi:hypothetical protein